MLVSRDAEDVLIGVVTLEAKVGGGPVAGKLKEAEVLLL